MAAPKGRGSTRIYKDASTMQNDPPPGCAARIEGEDMHQWVGHIDGPDDSVYAGGNFPFTLTLPPNYPYEPPHIRFQTKIYHPNIKSTGEHKHGFGVCIDILQKNKGWSPMFTVDRILLCVRSLFTDPNPDHPLEQEIAREYKTNRAKFDRKAKEYTQKYAIGKIANGKSS